MDERTTGLILRTRPLTETSLIVQWLTKDFGRMSTVAKGALRPKSPFRGKLDLFYLADLSFQPSRRSDLHTLREVKVLDFRRALRVEVGYLQQAAYFIQLVEQTTEVNTPVPGLFHLLAATLDGLTQRPPAAATVFRFELKLLVELGLSPDFARSSLSADAREVVHQLAKTEDIADAQLLLSPQLNRELDAFLSGFLIYHLGRVPKSRHSALAF